MKLRRHIDQVELQLGDGFVFGVAQIGIVQEDAHVGEVPAAEKLDHAVRIVVHLAVERSGADVVFPGEQRVADPFLPVEKVQPAAGNMERADPVDAVSFECALIQPTDDELEKLQTEARSALELVKEHKDELTDAQVDDILASLRKAYADADKRAMDGLVGKVEENPEAETVAGAIEPEPENDDGEDFDPETDLELQDDAEPETEDQLVSVAKEIKEKAPQIVNLLKTIFG